METKAITEGAMMATLTVIFAMTGIYFPLLGPVVMLVWTLPVVVMCLRRGLQAGAMTMAVSGFIIMILATPLNGISMLIRSAGPALVIGYGYYSKWPSEKTLLYTWGAAFVGLLASYALTFFVMGISVTDMFHVAPETIEEMVALFDERGLLASAGMGAQEMVDQLTETFSMLLTLIPMILVLSGLTSAITNYVAASFVLRRLKMDIPPMVNLSTFQLPFGLVFVFILGFGMATVGSIFFPQYTTLITIGRNILYIMLTLYLFQGLGVVSHYIKRAPADKQRFLKVITAVIFIWTINFMLFAMGSFGLADALFDVRKLSRAPDKK
jgi:uncharacterized protein YybS (DUF2232 family)